MLLLLPRLDTTLSLTPFADDLRRNTGNNRVIIDILCNNSTGSNLSVR